MEGTNLHRRNGDHPVRGCRPRSRRALPARGASIELNDVFLAAGRALAQIHRFEHNLKGLAALVHSIHNAGDSEPVVDFSGFSLGPLIDSVRRLVHVDPNFEALLEEARLRRNHLCHAYFHDHAAELNTEEGRNHLVQDLQTSELLFDRISDLATDLLQRLIKALDNTLTPKP